MWRDTLGLDARIIGVDINPKAKRLASKGFEIYICDQEKYTDLWALFESIGDVDIVIDDGAHTNPATVNTLLAASHFVRPGGIHIVEDLHTSFHPDFGNPSVASAFEYGVALAEAMSRAYQSETGYVDKPGVMNEMRKRVWSVEYFPSMLAVKYRDSDHQWERPVTVTNGKFYAADLLDMRNDRVTGLRTLSSWQRSASRTPRLLKNFIRRPGAWAESRARRLITARSARRRNRHLRNDLKQRGQWWG